MENPSSLKNLAAILGVIGGGVGIAGGSFGLGSVIGRTPVEARLAAHLAPEVIHPESAKRIDEHAKEEAKRFDELKTDFRDVEMAAREAATEARLTREAIRQIAAQTGTRPAGELPGGDKP